MLVSAAEYSEVDFPSVSSPRSYRLHHGTTWSVFAAVFSAKWRWRCVKQFCGVANSPSGVVSYYSSVTNILQSDAYNSLAGSLIEQCRVAA